MHSDDRSVFIPLTSHEFRDLLFWKSRTRMNRNWLLVNVVFIAAAALAVAFYFGRSLAFEMNYLWGVCWVIPWITFGFAIGKISNEWAHDTHGWWLALPYPRRTLIAAKFLALMVQGIAIISAIVLFMMLLGGYTTMISNPLSSSDFLAFIRAGILPVLIDCAALPIAAAAGMFIGVIAQTNLRSALTFFWVFWGIVWILLGISGWTVKLMNAGNHLSLLLIVTLASWAVAVLLLLFSVWLLEKRLNL